MRVSLEGLDLCPEVAEFVLWLGSRLNLRIGLCCCSRSFPVLKCSSILHAAVVLAGFMSLPGVFF
jgi:hypothetical protein